ncbi:hypothetical protein SDC9_101524 [bioreactor metagenome]|uniref:Uncharacterized protein n=1 Tax=bioreactor metagenome TaxID=1076179 RepID=A0A645AZ00_9ZZZZ
MKKILVATALGIFAATSAFAQLDKAAADANEAAQHKVEEKKAENQAAKSGPVGKAVNKTKAKYHKAQSQHHAKKAKTEVKNAVQ